MPALICPLCRLPLLREAAAWRCDNRHSFDVAREGYVNLLPVQQKKSRDPGDNPEMVQARRDFLQAGHYGPLRDAVIARLQTLNIQSLLDLGCGEGWYTGGMSAAASDITGLDIAKPAVRLAAKKHPGITWLVGSGAALPLADASVDAVCSLFSPLPVAEMQRVLKPGGYVLVARPAPDHLWKVREGLFGEVQAHQPEKFLPELQTAFTLQEQAEIRFPLHLVQTALKQLLAMTPYVWKAKPERRAALEAHEVFDTEAAFSLMMLRKA
ncbi:MAG TPA: methyltransferase domain-containing protein [Fluviicoccus sp.]|nr:methyltransferase domain-containing protein [Fluviicoccus sp.]